MTHQESKKADEKSLHRLKMARNYFMANFYMYSLAEEGKFDLPDLPARLDVRAGGYSRIFEYEGDNPDIRKFMRDNLIIAFGVAITMLDAEFNTRFNSNRLSDKDADRRSIRCIAFQIRNAVTHDPLTPIWVVRDEYKKVFSVPHIGIELDLTHRHGQPLGLKMAELIILHEIVSFSMQYFGEPYVPTGLRKLVN